MHCWKGEQNAQFLIWICSIILQGREMVVLYGQWFLISSFTRSWSIDAFEMLEWLSSTSANSTPLVLQLCHRPWGWAESGGEVVNSLWNQLHWFLRRKDDIKGLSQRLSSSYIFHSTAFSLFFPTHFFLHGFAQSSPSKSSFSGNRKGQSTLFFLFCWEQQHRKENFRTL